MQSSRMVAAQILSGVPTFGQQESGSRLFGHAEFALIIPELCKLQVILQRLGLEPKLLTVMRGSRCSRSRFETEMTSES